MNKLKDVFPKISIVTVVYNAKCTIEETVLSVINQTYNNMEYIIIDGGSDDGTINEIRKYENKVSYWISEPDQGIYDAMNKGIHKATGEYIYFLGADDCLIDENIIAKVAGYLEDDPVDVLSGRVWVANERFGIQTEYSNVFDLGDIYRGYCIPHQGLFVKAGILKKWLFDIKYKSSADRKMFYQLYFSPEVNFKFIEEKIAYYDDGGMSSCNIEVRTREDIDIMKEFNLPLQAIEKYRALYDKSLIKSVKESIKTLLDRLHLTKAMRLRRGWQPHSCSWNKCRWCGRG